MYPSASGTMQSGKRRRLSELASLAPISAAGLARIVQALGTDAPASASRFSVSRAISADVQVQSPVGPSWQAINFDLADGSTYKWEGAHPGAMLTLLCKYSSDFEAFLKMRLSQKPAAAETPWRICLYADEATVGNLLRVDPTRKSWLVYWSFFELGNEYLAHESGWFLLGVLRSKECALIPGGFSGFIRTVLKQWFFGNPFNFEKSGALIRVQDGSLLGPLFAQFGCMLGDESALSTIWRTKGASGNVNCIFCANVCRVGSELAQHSGGGLVSNAESDLSKFQLHTDQSRFDICDRLLRAEKKDVPRLEKAFGCHLDTFSLMYDVALREHVRPISHTMYDFGHVFLIHGVVHFTMTLMLLSLRGIGIHHKHIDQFSRPGTGRHRNTTRRRNSLGRRTPRVTSSRPVRRRFCRCTQCFGVSSRGWCPKTNWCPNGNAWTSFSGS